VSSSLSLLGEAFHVHPPGGNSFNKNGNNISKFCLFLSILPYVSHSLCIVGDATDRYSFLVRVFTFIGPYQGEDSLDSDHPLHLLGVLSDPALWHLELQILGPSVLDACYPRLE